MGLSPTGTSASIAARALSSPTTCRFIPALSGLPTIRLIDCFAGHLLPQLGKEESLAVADYSEEQIRNKDHTCADQADNPRIGECRVSREFSPSMLFGEGLDNLQHQRF